MAAPVVTVRGEARLEGPPELATLSVTLHAAGPSAERVRADLAEGSTALDQALTDFRSAFDRTGTSNLHVGPVFDQRRQHKITGYSGSLSVQLVVVDFEVLSDLILALSALANSQVDGPWWSLRPDSPLYRDARLAAITDARRRATDYAAAFGAKLVELIEVSDLDGGFAGGPPMRMAAFAKGREMAEDATLVLEPALQTVEGQVTVRFGLSEVVLGS